MSTTAPAPPSQSHLITPQAAHALAYGNLLRVFSERDATKRAAAMPTVYSPTCTIYYPNAESSTGSYSIIDTHVAELLTEREGWDFIPMGPVRLNHDFIFLAWGFGPRTSGVFGSGEPEGVEVKLTGSDHILVDPQSGLIEKLWVVIDGLADVRV